MQALNLLTKNNGRLSTQDLADAQLCQAVNLLEEDGYIFQRRDDGLLLTAVGDLLRPEYIAPYLQEPRRIRWFEVIDSTNDEAKRVRAAGDPGNLVVIAERQTAGKGRLGRSWQSDLGQEVQMSFLLKPDISPSESTGASFAAGLGIAAGLAEFGVDPSLKWPNDVTIGNRKICGILIETAVDADSLSYMVVGTGINVNQTAFEGDLMASATSLAMETGADCNRAQVAAYLIDSVFTYMNRFFEHGMPAVMDEYCSRSSVLNQEITIHTADGPILGRCIGFRDDGEIQVDCGGTVQCFSANDVSVRGTSTYA